MNDSLKGSSGIGLFRESTRLLDAGEIAHQYHAGARYGAHCRLRTLLVTTVQDDGMA
jgi:hypothetical protein